MNGRKIAMCLALAGSASFALAQQPAAPNPGAPAPAAPAATPARPAVVQGAPLKMNTMPPPPAKIEFPPADPSNFTAASPTKEQVDSFLKSMWGYDTNRVWQVSGVQETKAPGVVKVSILVGEQGISHGPMSTVFFVTPDGHHAVAGQDVIPFGPDPFKENREKLNAEAKGPARGAAGKDLLLVEFADLECPHCRDAQPIVDRLASDFPNARIVFENFPLTKIHPAAEKAAEYGVCVAKQKGDSAFFEYVKAVFDTQAGLEGNTEETLKNAVTKAGANPAEVSACAATPAAKAAVDRSVALGTQLGVEETPLLFIGGRPWPIAAMPYQELRRVVAYASTKGNPESAATATARKP